MMPSACSGAASRQAVLARRVPLDASVRRVRRCPAGNSAPCTLAFGALGSASVALPKSAREVEAAVWWATCARPAAGTPPHIHASARQPVADMGRSAYPVALHPLLSAAATRPADIRARPGRPTATLNKPVDHSTGRRPGPR
ncbi:hypothetical protein ACYF6T_00850 [Streptomyces sp. 7R007]